jgi:hypothetical protein
MLSNVRVVGDVLIPEHFRFKSLDLKVLQYMSLSKEVKLHVVGSEVPAPPMPSKEDWLTDHL